MAGGKQEDGPYVPANDPDESDPQPPNRAAKKKSPPQKSPKRQASLLTKSPPKAQQPSAPEPPQTPKTAKKGQKKVAGQTSTAVGSKPASPKTPGRLKSPKSPKKGSSKSLIVVDSTPPKSPESTTSKKDEIQKPKADTEPWIPGLAAIPKAENGEEWRLCRRPDEYWMRWTKTSGLDKKQLTTAIKYYIRPTDNVELKLSTQNKPVLLQGLKQIYFDRDDDSKWNETQLINLTGKPGEDDGMSAKDYGISGKEYEAANPKPKGEGFKKGKKRAADSPAEEGSTAKRPKPLETSQNRQGANGQRQGGDLRSEQLDERSRRFVEETIRRTLSTITYHDLNRHPLAYPREPVRTGTVASREDFEKVIPAAFSANSDIYLEFLQDVNQWNPHWRITNAEHQVASYPIRGRGPVWDQNSCAIDSCIVAGMLLDAGSTIADRKNDWPALSRREDEFLEIVEKNWSIMTRAQSIAERNNFWKILHVEARKEIEASDMKAEDKKRRVDDWQIGKMLPAATIWEACTRNFQQFHFKYFNKTGKCSDPACDAEGPRMGLVTAKSITPNCKKETASGTLHDALQTYFTISRRCRVCKKGTRITEKMVVREPPLRLVVFTDRECAITQHTDNVQLQICIADSDQWPTDPSQNDSRPDPCFTKKNVEYRWLGGIYYHNGHFRVYWSDNERTEPDQGNFKVYDGMNAEGAIVGQIATAHATERIHPEWVDAGAQTILFYERVLPPTTEVLEVAAETIKGAQGGASLVSTAPLAGLRTVEHASGRKNLSQMIVKNGLFSPITPGSFPQQGTNAGDPIDLISDESGGCHENPSQPPRAPAGRAPPRESEVLHQPVTPPGVVQPIAGDVQTSPSNGEYFMTGGLQPAPEPVDDGMQGALLQDIELNQTPSPGATGQETDAQMTGTQPQPADGTDAQLPQPATSEPNPITVNTIRMYPAITIEPSDYIPPPVGRFNLDDFDPRIQNDPEPTHEEMFPGLNPLNVRPRTRRTPTAAISEMCNECGQSVIGTEYLSFEDPEGTMLYIHDQCYECRRCGARLSGLGMGVEINRNEIAVWHGPVPEFDGEALCQICGEHLDKVEERAKRAAERAKEKREGNDADAMDIEQPPPPPPTRVMTSGWAAINLATTIREVALVEAGGDEPDEIEKGEEVDEVDEEWERQEEERKAKRRERDRKMREEKKLAAAMLKEGGEVGKEEVKKRLEEEAEKKKKAKEDARAKKQAEKIQEQEQAKAKKEDDRKQKEEKQKKKNMDGEKNDMTREPQTAESAAESEGEGDTIEDSEEESEDSEVGEFVEAEEDDDDDGEETDDEDEEEDDAPGNDAQVGNQEEPQESQDQPREDEQPQDELEDELMAELQDGLEDDTHEPGERSADWRDWTQGIVGEPGVEEDSRVERSGKEKAEKTKKMEEAKSRLPSLDISSEAKEPDMEATLGDEASNLPPPMGLELPEETERAFEIPKLDTRGYVPYAPTTATLKRKMSMDSLFGDDDDDNAEASVAGGVSEKERGPPSSKKLKSETEEDSMYG